MKLNINDIENLKKCGVYCITNILNNKYYIGSTKNSFYKRFWQHCHALRNNRHKNPYLQRSFNKYGEDIFVFSIIEICNKEIAYEREQYYLDKRDLKLSYNINPKATGPCQLPESYKKQSIARKKFYSECLPYYYKIKNGEITLEDVPQKFHAKIQQHLNTIPWNKGKKMEDTSCLKVKHKKGDRSNDKNTKRENAPIVYVYDEHWNFIDNFRSARDIQEMSGILKPHIKSRFNVSRMGKSVSYLCSGNINKAIKNHTQYKGLYFTTLPLHPGTDDVNEPKSVKVWNDNTEVIEEVKMSSTPYSIETETV